MSSRLPSSYPRWLLTALNAGLPNEPQHSLKALWRCVEGSLYSFAMLKSMRYIMEACWPVPIRTLLGLISRWMKLRVWTFCNRQSYKHYYEKFQLWIDIPIVRRSWKSYVLKKTDGMIQKPLPVKARDIQKWLRCEKSNCQTKSYEVCQWSLEADKEHRIHCTAGMLCHLRARAWSRPLRW